MPYLNSRGRAILLFALLIVTTSVHAQRTTGDLLGVVKDASGSVLPGVSVSVTGPVYGPVTGSRVAVDVGAALSTL